MSGSEPAEMSDRVPEGESAPEDAAGTAQAGEVPVPEAVPAESTEVSEVYEEADSSEVSRTSETAESTETVETVGTAEASGPVDAWASPDGAARTDPAAPTMAVPIAQPQPPIPAAAPQYPVPGAAPQYAAPAPAPQYAAPAPAPQYQVPGQPAAYPQPGQPGQPMGYPQPGQPGYGYMQPYQYTPSPEEVAAALEAKRKRKRKLWTWTAVVAVVAVVGAGVVVVESGRHGNSVVSAVTCAPAKLSSCLIKQPQGAETLSDTPTWDQAAVPSMEAVGANITADAKDMASQTSIALEANGENAVAHTDWNAVDGNDVDMVLLKFATIKGAQSWNAARNGEILAAYTGPSVAISGDSAEKAHAAAKADAKGDYHAAYSAVVGNIVLNLSYTSPNKFDPADLQNWAGTELASLGSAPKPAKDPADTSSGGTEEVSCSRLTSCLPSTPSGFGPWLAPPKGWTSSRTLTPKQYVKYEYLAADVSDVEANFSKYNITGVAHTDWANASAEQQTDVYLIQALTEAGAQGVYSDNFGEPVWPKGEKGISFSIPGEPDAQAWYANKKENGFTDVYYTTRVGNTIVEAWSFFYGSVNKAVASKWATSTINKVKVTEAQKPVGLPSLGTPTVKIPAQGSCSASGDCLVALPSGAKDTTQASTMSSSKSVTAEEYAVGYESDFNQQFTGWLGDDGFQSGEHRSWKASSGATADGVLLKFGSPAQAQAAAMLEYGLGTESDRVCTISSVSNAYCMADPVGAADYYQMETVSVVAWKGDYEVRVSVTVSNSAQVAQAYAWAEQQLAMLPAS